MTVKMTRAASISTGTQKLSCPLCGNKDYPEHKSGNGCAWCSHATVCEACIEAEKAKAKR